MVIRVANLLSTVSEVVDFKVVWNKKPFDVSLSLNDKVLKLKQHMESLVGKLNRCDVCVQASVNFNSIIFSIVSCYSASNLKWPFFIPRSV